MASELATVYEPKAVEQKVYQRWIETGAFDADPDSQAKPYCIVIPPPNVTAVLHVGHATPIIGTSGRFDNAPADLQVAKLGQKQNRSGSPHGAGRSGRKEEPRIASAI